ncbi:MAG: polysaccharide biosynthesis tyrosine autokinase [Lachnospiraceae bacterium]
MEEQTKDNLYQKIDLISMLRDIIPNWWVILLIAVAMSLFTNIYVNQSYEPTYTARTTFAVTTKGSNGSIYQNLTSAKELAARFTQILGSNLLKKAVAEDLGLDEFQAQTSAVQITETNLVELTVTANSPMQAFLILNSILENYTEVTDYVIGNVILEVIQAPSIPMSPSNSVNVKRQMEIVFLVTAALVFLYLALCSYLRDTVKNPQQVREKIDTRYLGTIYHEKKGRGLLISKKNKTESMLIENPLRSFAFVESNRMVTSRVRSLLEHRKCKVFMVTSVMENEGKSTVVANIALSLAQEGKKVLLIDCDFRKPSQQKIFQLKEDDCIQFLELLKDPSRAQGLIRQYRDTSLYTILNKVPINFSENQKVQTLLSSVIERYREEMDYIILDTSPMALVSDTEELAHLMDATLLVVREDWVLAKHINDKIDILNQTKGKVLGCIFNDASRFWTSNSAYSSYGNYGGYYGKRTK